jgi:hypothetical protein
MAYGSESYDGRAQRGGRIQDDSRAYRGEVEEEPTDLDTPESDGLDDDELEDVAASPLAEDAPIAAGEDEEDEDASASDETVEAREERDEAEAGSGARRDEAAVMSHGARRRQFPAAGKIKAKSIKRAKTARRPKTARVA